MNNIVELSMEDFAKFFTSFDTVITDINGVLWNDRPIPKVGETIRKLKSRGKAVHYVSNNSFLSYQEYERHFNALGVDLDRNDLVFPTLTLLDYLESISFNKKLFCISGDSLQKCLSDAGYQCVHLENIYSNDISVALAAIADDPEIGAVYVDSDINTSYIKICKALSILKREEVLFIVGAADKTIPITSTKSIIGPGVFVDIISQYSGRKPLVLGKPSEFLKSLILKRFKIDDPTRVLFIGDILEQDMAFGSVCGFKKLLVLSGIDTLEKAESQTDSALRPDFYMESLGHLSQLI